MRLTLGFAICTWAPHTKTGIQTIERVQRSAARFVTGDYRITSIVRALNVRKGHNFSHLDKSMTFGTDDLHAILFQNFDGSNLRF